eukprot:3934604-Rhodomonas_salina.3
MSAGFGFPKSTPSDPASALTRRHGWSGSGPVGKQRQGIPKPETAGALARGPARTVCSPPFTLLILLIRELCSMVHVVLNGSRV